MRLEYLHRSGGTVLTAPSGADYDFSADSDGRRVAEVQDKADAAWFLTLTNQLGQPLFQALSKPKAKLAEVAKVVDPVEAATDA